MGPDAEEDQGEVDETGGEAEEVDGQVDVQEEEPSLLEQKRRKIWKKRSRMLTEYREVEERWSEILRMDGTGRGQKKLVNWAWRKRREHRKHCWLMSYHNTLETIEESMVEMDDDDEWNDDSVLMDVKLINSGSDEEIHQATEMNDGVGLSMIVEGNVNLVSGDPGEQSQEGQALGESGLPGESAEARWNDFLEDPDWEDGVLDDGEVPRVVRDPGLLEEPGLPGESTTPEGSSGESLMKKTSEGFLEGFLEDPGWEKEVGGLP